MLAIFGGSFDPVHLGHLQNAAFIQQQFKFQEFLMLPCGDPPHKEKLLFNQDDRLKMLELALQDYPNLSISDFEIWQTKNNNKVSYTIDTLRYFRKKYGKICFVMGSDSFLDLPNWDEFEKFASLTNILVLDRDFKGDTALLKFSEEKNITKFKNSIGKVYFATNNLINISSTQIRSKIYNRHNLVNLVPPAVINYINERKTKTTN